MDIKRACVLALVSAACISDLKSGKVKNRIAAAGWAAGFVISCIFAENVPHGIAGFLTGAGIPLAAGYFLFRLRLLGAGDVKLFSAVGGITGIRTLGAFAVWSFVFGGAVSALILLCGDNARRAAGRMRDFAQRTAAAGRPVPYRDYSAGKGMFHFTVPILMAAVMYAGGMI